MAFNEYKFFELEWAPDVILDVGSYLDVKTFHQAAAIQLMPFQNLKREVNVELRNAPMSYVKPSVARADYGNKDIQYAGSRLKSVVIDEENKKVVAPFRTGSVSNGYCPYYANGYVTTKPTQLADFITLSSLLFGLRVNLKLVDPIFDEDVLYDLHCFMFTSFISRINLSVLQERLIYTEYAEGSVVFGPSTAYTSGSSNYYNDVYQNSLSSSFIINAYFGDKFDYYSNKAFSSSINLASNNNAWAKGGYDWVLKEIDLSFMSKYPERYSNLTILGRGLMWLKNVTLPEDLSFVKTAKGLFYCCHSLEFELCDKEIPFTPHYFAYGWKNVKLENINFTSTEAFSYSFYYTTLNPVASYSSEPSYTKAFVSLAYDPSESVYKSYVTDLGDELFPSVYLKNVTFNNSTNRMENCFYRINTGDKDIFIDINLPNYESYINAPQLYTTGNIIFNANLPEGVDSLAVSDTSLNIIGHTITLKTPFTYFNTNSYSVALYCIPCSGGINIFAKRAKFDQKNTNGVVYKKANKNYTTISLN